MYQETGGGYQCATEFCYHDAGGQACITGWVYPCDACGGRYCTATRTTIHCGTHAMLPACMNLACFTGGTGGGGSGYCFYCYDEVYVGDGFPPYREVVFCKKD